MKVLLLRLLSPLATVNIILVIFGTISLFCFEIETAAVPVVWRDVALGAIAVAGFLLTLGVRDFMGQVRQLRRDFDQDQRRRTIQHEQNQAKLSSIVLALKTGDSSNLD